MMLHNQFPTVDRHLRLGVICEAATKDDELKGKAFSGGKHRGLCAVLASVGALPQACYFGNMYPRGSPYGSIDIVSSANATLQAGCAQLHMDLAVFRPNCLLICGPNAMKYAGVTKHNLENYRGSLFWSETFNCKCIATFDILRGFQTPADMALIKFDVHFAHTESASPELNLPQHILTIADDIGTAFNHLNQLSLPRDTPLAFDVEGFPDGGGITCFSFAVTANESVVIPLRRNNGFSVFSPQEEVLIWSKLTEILSNPEIPKICQNGLYELFIMAWRHGIVIANVQDDTMIKHWELYSELKKGLGLLTSIYTRVPYFKDGRHDATDIGHWEYNAKDSCILIDIDSKLDGVIRKRPRAYEAYVERMLVLKPYVYLSMRGCLLDKNAIALHRSGLWSKICDAQMRLNKLVGRAINVKSNKDKPWLLYEHLKLPKKFKLRKLADGNEQRLTADEETILTLLYDATEEKTRQILTVLHELIKYRTDFSDTYKLIPFSDGRIRSSFNPVGTETGRSSSSATSVRAAVEKPKFTLDKTTGAPKIKLVRSSAYLGTNLQNVSKWLRNVLIPKKAGCFWQYDFSGADAWTVAADCAALGNDKMLKHLSYGIKPSLVILLLQKYGADVFTWDDAKIKELQGSVKTDIKMYTCSKACQHGTNYMMRAPLLAATIFKRSGGKIRIPVALAQTMQDTYEAYYTVSKRHRWVREELSKTGMLGTANGTSRRFFGVRIGQPVTEDVLRVALAYEPQYNTTLATNRALSSLYYEDFNRMPDGAHFKCDPQLMIHDALAGEHVCEREEAEQILDHVFKVPMTIHGIKITIPAEGGFGNNWKDCE